MDTRTTAARIQSKGINCWRIVEALVGSAVLKRAASRRSMGSELLGSVTMIVSKCER